MEIALDEYNKIFGRMNSVYHEAALKLGLSDSKFDILYALCSHEDGCYQSVLYKETWKTKSTINSAIRSMEKEGILYLIPAEGRNTRVYLTEKGKRLTENTVCKIIAMENTIYHSWTPEQQQLFLQINRDFTEKLAAMVNEL